MRRNKRRLDGQEEKYAVYLVIGSVRLGRPARKMAALPAGTDAAAQ